MTKMFIALIFVTLIMSWISIASMYKARKMGHQVEGRTEIGEAIEEHPFTLNPIVWVIIIASLFVGFTIVYYAASFS